MIVWHQAHRAAQLVAAAKPGAREDTIGMVLRDMGYRLTQPVPPESLYDLTKLAVWVRLHARAMKEEQT